MKKNIILICILGIFFQESYIDASTSGGAQNFVQQMQSFGSSIGTMFKGLGSMVGLIPDGYQCNWEVINDTDQEIDLYYKNFISVMGGFFPSSDDISGGSLHEVQPYSATFTYSMLSAGTVLGGPPPKSSSSSSTSTKPTPTSGLYNGVHPYFALFMGYSPAGTSLKDSSTKGTNFYKEYQLQLGRQYDNSINYYHVYTGKRFVNGNASHMIMVEMAGGYDPDATQPDASSNLAFSSNLGQMNPDPKAPQVSAGSVYIYNTMLKPVEFAVTLSDGTKYLDIVLEPLSYNLLSCLAPQTINGSTLTFGGASPFKTITVPSMTIQGNNYIFEIYQDVGQASANVAIQGFNPGNYDICVSSNMRDISPQQAVLWIESVAQQNAQKPPVSNPGNYDLQGQVWMVYQSASVTTMQKVELGTPTTLHFTRPPLADQIGYLYFIYVNTQTDADAKNFINNFLSGVFGTAIKKQALSVINTAIDLNKIEKSLVSEQKNAGTVIDQENIAAGKNKVVSAVTDSSPMTLSNTLAQEVLSGTVPANIARLQDPTKNITGYLLGVDVFTSFGGQLPPISYYQLTPATISFDTLANLLNQYIDSTKIKSLRSNTNTANTKNKIDAQSQISDAMNAQITTWFGDYVSKGSQAVQAEIVAFLSKYGSATLFDSKGALTKGGLNRVKSFVNGLVSLANPPILYSSIITQSPAYAVITGMPGASGSVATTTTVAASKAIQS